MPSVDEIRFLFVVEDPQGLCAEQRVTISKPVLDASATTWICELSWDGPIVHATRIYGATSLQSLSLAIDLIQSELASALRGRTITESGAPWFSVLGIR